MRAGLRGGLRMLGETIRLEVAASMRYRFSVVSDVALFTLLLGLLVSSGTGTSYAAEFGVSDWRPLLLLGYVAWVLSSFALTQSVRAITDELVRGTFYRKLNATMPLGTLLAAQFLGGLVIQAVELCAILLVGRLVWGVGLSPSVPLVLGLLACTAGMYGVGLALAGLSLLFKRVGSLLTLFQISLLFITDTLPTLPVISTVTRFLPLTLCNEVMREAATGGAAMGGLVVLLCLSALWLAAGYGLFFWLLVRSKRKGTLLLY